MDSERDGRTPARAWLAWFLGLAVVAAGTALYTVAQSDNGRPSSVTIFGVNGPHAQMVSYPGVRVRALGSQVASAALIR